MLTFIPNIPSIIGIIQKYVDREVYDVHLPITKKNLISSHHLAGLNLESCEHFMSINLGVVNSGKFSSHFLNKPFRHILSSITKIFWIFEKYGLKIPKNRFTSPYIISLAKK